VKYSTQYLFDKPKSTYEPEQSILAKRKIEDGRALMQKLSKIKTNMSIEEMAPLIERYRAAEESVQHWRNILDEE
jgi:hypothetical protein